MTAGNPNPANSVPSSSVTKSATDDPVQLAEKLLEYFRDWESCLVAFSGGVDSSLVAAAGARALGDKALAATAVSPSLAGGELETARSVAAEIGIRHIVVCTGEMDSPNYRQNDNRRCYFCKDELYSQLQAIAAEQNVAVICNGSNRDDLGDYRPGLEAASEHSIRSPLADCGFHKDDVRRLAQHWNLPVWDKPASPCLSSRIAYGEEVTPERLRMIDQAEVFLRQQGLQICRVRYHKGDVARIEVPSEAILRLAKPAMREAITQELHRLGFKFISLDLEGFRSGSLNQLVPVEALTQRTE